MSLVYLVLFKTRSNWQGMCHKEELLNSVCLKFNSASINIYLPGLHLKSEALIVRDFMKNNNLTSCAIFDKAL